VDTETMAKFANVRGVTDWDAVADEVPEIVERLTTITVDYDYKAICKEADIEPIVIGQSVPSVSIKIK
jgi:hypothetical protein